MLANYTWYNFEHFFIKNKIVILLVSSISILRFVFISGSNSSLKRGFLEQPVFGRQLCSRVDRLCFSFLP